MLVLTKAWIPITRGTPPPVCGFAIPGIGRGSEFFGGPVELPSDGGTGGEDLEAHDP